MARTLDTPPEVGTETSETAVSQESPMIAKIGDNILHYSATPQVAVKRPPLAKRKRRGYRIAWYELGIIGLVVLCAFVCIFRLIWSMHR